MLYATRLADEGYAALIFDPGESTGQPRPLENPKIKNEDMVAELDYLPARGGLDASRLFLAGICQGDAESLDVADVASCDSKVSGVASISGCHRDHETDIYMTCAGCVAWESGAGIAMMKMPTPGQGEALYKAGLERATQARELYEKTGEVVHQPLADPKAR